MEMMTTKKELIERLKDIKCVEMEAMQGYEEDVFTFKNFELKEVIGKIKRDEDKHILILESMIKSLED